jgi:hypothetical protein
MRKKNTSRFSLSLFFFLAAYQLLQLALGSSLEFRELEYMTCMSARRSSTVIGHGRSGSRQYILTQKISRTVRLAENAKIVHPRSLGLGHMDYLTFVEGFRVQGCSPFSGREELPGGF